MAEGMKSEEEKAGEARRGPPVQRRGPGAGIGAPVEKPQQFLPSAKRVLGLLRPDRTLLVVVLALGAVSVMLSALGPLILARATDLIFAGVFSRRLASGTTQERAVQDLREQGRDTVATFWARWTTSCPARASTSGRSPRSWRSCWHLRGGLGAVLDMEWGFVKWQGEAPVPMPRGGRLVLR